MSQNSRVQVVLEQLPGLIIALLISVATFVLRTVVVKLPALSNPFSRRFWELFIIEPLGSEAYPEGLHAAHLIDAVLLSLCMLTIVNLGRRIGSSLVEIFPEIPDLDHALRLVGILGAVVTGFYAYKAILLPPLISVRLGALYTAGFLLIAVLVGALLVVTITRMAVQLRGRRSVD